MPVFIRVNSLFDSRKQRYAKLINTFEVDNCWISDHSKWKMEKFVHVEGKWIVNFILAPILIVIAN